MQLFSRPPSLHSYAGLNKMGIDVFSIFLHKTSHLNHFTVFLKEADKIHGCILKTTKCSTVR